MEPFPLEFTRGPKLLFWVDFFLQKNKTHKSIQQYKIKLWKFTANAFPKITFWSFVCIGNSEKLEHQDSTVWCGPSLSVDFPFPTKRHKRKKHREKMMSQNQKKETKPKTKTCLSLCFEPAQLNLPAWNSVYLRGGRKHDLLALQGCAMTILQFSLLLLTYSVWYFLSIHYDVVYL